MAAKKPVVFADYPIFSVVALDEGERIVLGGGGGSAKTGVPNSVELYKIELIGGVPTSSLLSQHNFGSTEVVGLSSVPPRRRGKRTSGSELVVSVANSSVVVQLCEPGAGTSSGEGDGVVGLGSGQEKEGKGQEDEDEKKEGKGQEDEEGEKEEEESKGGTSRDETPPSVGNIEVTKELFPVSDSDRTSAAVEDTGPVEGVPLSEQDAGGDSDQSDDSEGSISSESSDTESVVSEGEEDLKEKLEEVEGEGKPSVLRKRKGTSKGAEDEEESCKVSPGVVKDPELSFVIGEKHRTDFSSGEESLQKAAQVTSDGRFVVTGGMDGCVRVWKYPSFEKVHELKGHYKEISDLAVHPSKPVAVSLSFRASEALVWDVREGKRRASFSCQPRTGSEYWTRAGRFSPAVASDSENDDAILHSLVLPVKNVRSNPMYSYLVRRECQGWSVTKTTAVAKEMLTALCVSGDGRVIAVGTSSGSILVFNHSYQLLTKASNVHSFAVTDLALCSLPCVRPERDGEEKNKATKRKRKTARKRAVVSVSVDRACQVTLVSRNNASWSWSSIFCLSIVVLLLAIIWCLLYL